MSDFRGMFGSLRGPQSIRSPPSGCNITGTIHREAVCKFCRIDVGTHALGGNLLKVGYGGRLGHLTGILWYRRRGMFDPTTPRVMFFVIAPGVCTDMTFRTPFLALIHINFVQVVKVTILMTGVRISYMIPLSLNAVTF